MGVQRGSVVFSIEPRNPLLDGSIPYLPISLDVLRMVLGCGEGLVTPPWVSMPHRRVCQSWIHSAGNWVLTEPEAGPSQSQDLTLFLKKVMDELGSYRSQAKLGLFSAGFCFRTSLLWVFLYLLPSPGHHSGPQALRYLRSGCFTKTTNNHVGSYIALFVLRATSQTAIK